ncbi:MAG: ATP-dependent helicase RhlE [Solirubrobacteraceae bacterium]|jgi:superfamily II DNA/RNA helicase|nr:ATP-dependent helicase RhlE [Solirubrobacteraceae bacterium]
MRRQRSDPIPNKSFADLGVSNAVCSALQRRGVTKPFAVQQLVLDDVLAGRDALVKSPTGSGKTLAFAIPIVERLEADGPRPAALVLAPTRELVTQIVQEIREIAHARALRVTAVYGGVGIAKQAGDAARSHVVVATPGRLEDLLARGAFSLSAIRILVLDEADRMLDMGFRPAVDRIVAACPKRRQTLFFSATLDGIAGRVAAQYTDRAVVHQHGPSGSRAVARVEHRFVAVTDESRVRALVGELTSERELALVFVRTKRGADRLVKHLDGHGVSAIAIHGNKSQRQREHALSRFQSGRIDTLVATDVAARGIDVDGISHVINFNPPGDHDAYIHRIGRTGRAGRPGVGITLVGAGERNEMRRLTRRLGIGNEPSADEVRAPRGTPKAAPSPRHARPQPPRRSRASRRRAAARA